MSLTVLLIPAKILVSILAVVGLSLVAERVSPKVAGILSSYPLDISALIAYALSVSLTYPRYGVPFGTVLAFLAATVYLLLLAALTRRQGR